MIRIARVVYLLPFPSLPELTAPTTSHGLLCKSVDALAFGSLADLYSISNQEGYMGGLRLMQATCKKFYEFCSKNGIAVARSNFKLQYDTNIPRQVGLAGSSAIVTATLNCLMKFFRLSNLDIPKPMRPNFVLSVEFEELGINAGLQDRVSLFGPAPSPCEREN